MANANPNLTRKTLVVCKSEDTYGADAFGGTAATSSTDSGAYLLWDEINPLQLDTQHVEMQSVRASYSKNEDLVGRQLYMLRPKTQFMASPGSDHTVAATDPKHCCCPV